MPEITFNITMPEPAQQLAVKAAEFMAQVESFEITCQEHLDNSVRLGSEIKAVRNQLEKERLAQTRPMDTAKKDLMDLYQPYLNQLDQAVQKIEGAGRKYVLAVREQQRKEQERLEAEARETERKEKERLAKLAEKQMDAGKMDKAAETIERIDAVTVAAPIVAPTYQQPKNSGLKGKHRLRVTDPSKVPAYWNGAELRAIDQRALDKYAEMMHGQNSPPGTESYFEEDLKLRAARH
jgi:hypothetical protein